MSAEENRELQALLKGSCSPKVVSPRNGRNSFYDEDEDETSSFAGGFTQWTSTDGKKFFPAGDTFAELNPGFYEPKYSSERGYFMSKLDWKTDGLLTFPETNSEKVLAEIQMFWEKEELFRAHGLSYKRGIILWGPPGSGKSCTIKLVLRDVVSRGGVAVKFNHPQTFIECVRIFRNIQTKTPLVVLLEDIDSIIAEFGETEVLNILDGVESVDKVVFIATTNYPEELGERIINRPSRFDRRFKMPHPGKASRKLYFEHLFAQAVVESDKINIDQWVSDTKGMSIAHLKELFIAVCILGDPYDDVVGVLRSMIEEKISSDEDRHSNIGFMPYNGNDE